MTGTEPPSWLNGAVRSRRRLSRPFLGVAFAVIALGATEVALRLAGVAPAYQPDQLGSWRFRAGAQESVQGPRDGHQFRVTTNADGLRTNLPRDRASAVPRVALMGDSTVFGWGVDDSGTVADGARDALGGVEVLNAGQPGYSTAMVAWLFGEVVGAYRPDLTVVCIPMHDGNRVLVSDWEVLHGGATPTAWLRVQLARNSRIYEMFRRALFANPDRPSLLPQEADDEPRVPRVSDDERTAAIDAMRTHADTWGGRIALSTLPFQGDIEGGGARARPMDAWIADYTASRGIPFLDVRACCGGEPGLVLADDPGHLSREGNLRAGTALGAAIAPLVTAPPP